MSEKLGSKGSHMRGQVGRVALLLGQGHGLVSLRPILFARRLSLSWPSQDGPPGLSSEAVLNVRLWGRRSSASVPWNLCRPQVSLLKLGRLLCH